MIAGLTVFEVISAYYISKLIRFVYVLAKWEKLYAEIVAMNSLLATVRNASGRVESTFISFTHEKDTCSRSEPFRPEKQKAGDLVCIFFKANHPFRFHSENWLRTKIAMHLASCAFLLVLGSFVAWRG